MKLKIGRSDDLLIGSCCLKLWESFPEKNELRKNCGNSSAVLFICYNKCEMFANLSRNETFRNDFSNRLREMRDIVFEENLVNKKLDEYKILMSDPMEKHFQRFHGCANNEFHNRRRKMRTFANSRKDYIETMLEENGFD